MGLRAGADGPKSIFDKHLRTKKTPPKTKLALDFPWRIADNIGMKHIYSVEIFEHHVGIQDYWVFSSSVGAEQFADGYMTQREEHLGMKYAMDRPEEEDMLRIWESQGESVIIRKKDLLG